MRVIIIFSLVFCIVVIVGMSAFLFLVNPYSNLEGDEEDGGLHGTNLEEEIEVVEENEDPYLSSDGAGGGSGGSSDGITETEDTMVCDFKQIHYSLKNFQEDVVCLESDQGVCIKLNAICSVDVYNIDVDVEENFTIEYALIDTTENDLDTINIINNVNTTSSVKFEANFTIEEASGIDILSGCTPRILVVPRKEICV